LIRWTRPAPVRCVLLGERGGPTLLNRSPRARHLGHIDRSTYSFGTGARTRARRLTPSQAGRMNTTHGNARSHYVVNARTGAQRPPASTSRRWHLMWAARSSAALAAVIFVLISSGCSGETASSNPSPSTLVPATTTPRPIASASGPMSGEELVWLEAIGTLHKTMDNTPTRLREEASKSSRPLNNSSALSIIVRDRRSSDDGRFAENPKTGR